MPNETTPLLGDSTEAPSGDPYKQFCLLVGIPLTEDKKHLKKAPETRLYGRAIHMRKSQSLTYSFTAALSNTLLLSQVVLGATLTALGASNASHLIITLFGVVNTIIAGLVAYLKSRGQPMRARMLRDDLEDVVDEIENSKIMWLGIRDKAHGYDEIDIEDKVSVRSEVARLTRLYDTAVKKYKQNNPDSYSGKEVEVDPDTGLKARPTDDKKPSTEDKKPSTEDKKPTTSDPQSQLKPKKSSPTAVNGDKSAVASTSASKEPDPINADASPATGMAPARKDEGPEPSGGTKDVLKTPT